MLFETAIFGVRAAWQNYPRKKIIGLAAFVVWEKAGDQAR
jgi:hypothetical protein